MLGRIDAYLAVYDAHFPAFDRLRSRGTRGPAAGNVKAPLMEGTLDFFAHNVALGQISGTMGAFILRHVKGAIDVVNGVGAALRFSAKRASGPHFRCIAKGDQLIALHRRYSSGNRAFSRARVYQLSARPPAPGRLCRGKETGIFALRPSLQRRELVSSKVVIARAFLAALALSASGPLAAQHKPDAPYPTRPVRWVVPYAAGGLPDSVARMTAPKVAEELGQQ